MDTPTGLASPTCSLAALPPGRPRARTRHLPDRRPAWTQGSQPQGTAPAMQGPGQAGQWLSLRRQHLCPVGAGRGPVHRRAILLPFAAIFIIFHPPSLICRPVGLLLDYFMSFDEDVNVAIIAPGLQPVHLQEKAAHTAVFHLVHLRKSHGYPLELDAAGEPLGQGPIHQVEDQAAGRVAEGGSGGADRCGNVILESMSLNKLSTLAQNCFFHYIFSLNFNPTDSQGDIEAKQISIVALQAK